MSLLDKGTESVVLYPEVVVTDMDGNKRTQPSSTGVSARASVQPLTSTEDQAVGNGSEQKYRMRLSANYTAILGAQSAVEWRGKKYHLDGDGRIFGNSPRTRHVVYVLTRA